MKTDKITNEDIKKVEEQIKKLQAKKSELKKKEVMKREQEIIDTKIKLYDALSNNIMQIYNIHDEQTLLHWLATTDLNTIKNSLMESIGKKYLIQNTEQES